MVVVARSAVERGNMTPVMQSPISDTSEDFRPCRRIRQNPCHGCSPTKQSYLDFVFPPALERIHRRLLPFAAGCDVGCVLQCSSDCRVWSPVTRPDKRSTVNTLVTQVWDFIPVVGRFAIKRRLRCVSSSCCCIGGSHTHIQGGACVPRQQQW